MFLSYHDFSFDDSVQFIDVLDTEKFLNVRISDWVSQSMWVTTI